MWGNWWEVREADTEPQLFQLLLLGQCQMPTRADEWVGTAEGWRDWALAMAQIRHVMINEERFSAFCVKLSEGLKSVLHLVNAAKPPLSLRSQNEKEKSFLFFFFLQLLSMALRLVLCWSRRSWEFWRAMIELAILHPDLNTQLNILLLPTGGKALDAHQRL